MTYPGRAVRKGDLRTEIVTNVQQRLVNIGCGPLSIDGVFGDNTESSVKLFQTRRRLHADGIVGPLTWDALFDEEPFIADEAPTPLLRSTLIAALSQNGVREILGSPNRGPQVDQYVRSLGLDPAGGYSWCQAFIYWSFQRAAEGLTVPNPCIKTAGVLDHWQKSPANNRIQAWAAADNPTLIRPGAIFIIDHGSGKGHAGLVTRVVSGKIETIEGNTNQIGSREGDGVYEQTRVIASVNVGFIDYGH